MLGRNMVGKVGSIALALTVVACGESTLFGGARIDPGKGGNTGAGGEGGQSSVGGGPSSGGSGGTTTAAGGSESHCEAGVVAQTASDVLLWTRLDDLASVTNPDSGDGTNATVQTSPANDFVPALSDYGLHTNAPDEWARFPQGGDNIRLDRGSFDFCYQPAFNHTDNVAFAFFGTDFLNSGVLPGYIRLLKTAPGAGSSLQLVLNSGSNFAQWDIPSASYKLEASTWYRITATWTTGNGNLADVHIYIDGVEVFDPTPPLTALQMPNIDAGRNVFIGALNAGIDPGMSAQGILDDFVIYDRPIVP